MAGGVVTSRLILVAPDLYVAAVNDRLRAIDPTSPADVVNTPQVLVSDPTRIAAWCCNWPTDEADKAEINRAMAGLSQAERHVHTSVVGVPPFGTAAAPTQRVWQFDGTKVTLPQALAALGLTDAPSEQ